MDDLYDTVGGVRPEAEVLSDLRTRLRSAADAHVPDRERMLARVERGMTEGVARPEARRGRSGGTGGNSRGHRSPSGPAPWARVVGVTAGLVGAFGIGGLAVGLTTNGVEPPQTVVTSPGPAAPPDVPSPTVSESHRPVPPAPSDDAGSTWRPGTPSTSTGSPPAAATSPSFPDSRRGNHPQDDYLWSDGTVDPSGNAYWAQSNVTLKTEKPMTELTVVLRIARTAGVSSTGAWSTVSSDDYDLSVTKNGDAIVYRWTLRAGKTIPVGTHVFAGQYNHAQGGRDAGGDVYAAQGDGPSGTVEVRGDFY